MDAILLNFRVGVFYAASPKCCDGCEKAKYYSRKSKASCPPITLSDSLPLQDTKKINCCLFERNAVAISC